MNQVQEQPTQTFDDLRDETTKHSTIPSNKRLFTLGVLDRLLELSKERSLTSTERGHLYEAGLNINRGYSPEIAGLSNTGSQTIDIFTFLTGQNVHPTVARLVLHQTFSSLLDKMLARDTNVYKENPLEEKEHYLMHILNEAILTTDESGKKTTPETKLEEMKSYLEVAPRGKSNATSNHTDKTHPSNPISPSKSPNPNNPTSSTDLNPAHDSAVDVDVIDTLVEQQLHYGYVRTLAKHLEVVINLHNQGYSTSP